MPDFNKICSQYKQDWTTIIDRARFETSSAVLPRPGNKDVAYAIVRVSLVSLFAFAALKSAFAGSIVKTAFWIVATHETSHLLINDQNMGKNPLKIAKTAVHTAWTGFKSLFSGNHPLNGIAKERAANTILQPLWVPLFEISDEARLRLHFQ